MFVVEHQETDVHQISFASKLPQVVVKFGELKENKLSFTNGLLIITSKQLPF
jgi:hypothetical protein